jgi:hypothetical protein
MKGLRIAFWITLLVCAAALLPGGAAAAQGQPPAWRTEAHSVGAQDVLYDQLALGMVNGAASQNFETALNSFDIQVADDFDIPAGTFFWSITQIEVDGLYGDAGYQAVSANVFFYNSTGTLPGTSFYSAAFVPTAASLQSGDFVINLNPPAGLISGREYWMSVQANLDSAGTGRQWRWGLRTAQTGNAAALINPGNGWAYDCMVWKAIGSCNPATTEKDLQFRLSGQQINIASTIYLPTVFR